MSTIARRVHRTTRARSCFSCGGPIPKGTLYRYWVGHVFGNFAVSIECPACAERYGRPITDA